MKKIVVLLLAMLMLSGCAQTTTPSTDTSTTTPTTFQEQCGSVGIEVIYEDPNAELDLWKPTGESDNVADFDTMSGASLGTTYMSSSQQGSSILSFADFADRQNQKIRTWGWYPAAATATMRTGLYFEVNQTQVTSIEEACALPEAKYITTMIPEDVSEESPYIIAALLGFVGTETFIAPDGRWIEDYEGTGYGKFVNGDEDGMQNANGSYLRQIGFMEQLADDPYNYSGEDRYVHIINIGHHSVQEFWMDPETQMAVEEGTEGAVLYQVNPIETTAQSAIMNGNMRTIYMERDERGMFGLGVAYYSEILYTVDYDTLVFFNQVTSGLPICMSDSTEQQIKLYPEQELSSYIGQDWNDQGDWDLGEAQWERSWLMEDRVTAGTALEPGTVNANLLEVGSVEAPTVFASKEDFITACKEGNINYMDLYASKGAIMPTEGIYSDANPDGRVPLVVTNLDLTLVADKAFYR
ncbi:MAG: hypothetical protein R3Y57_01300 [Erysipelotrichaceae bacterium]